MLGAIMSILDITVVSVAQPTFQTEFDATPAQTAWTMTGYTLALASVIPLTGWAADRFGTKRLYMLAVALFAGGSVLCAAADSIETLTAFVEVDPELGDQTLALGAGEAHREEDQLGRELALGALDRLELAVRRTTSTRRSARTLPSSSPRNSVVETA